MTYDKKTVCIEKFRLSYLLICYLSYLRYKIHTVFMRACFVKCLFHFFCPKWPWKRSVWRNLGCLLPQPATSLRCRNNLQREIPENDRGKKQRHLFCCFLFIIVKIISYLHEKKKKLYWFAKQYPVFKTF